jgi:protein-disulfide isomerase-like protein with CxxC motif
MPTLTFVFDPYCRESVAAAPAVLELWRTHRTQLHFETVHTGRSTARLGFGPDSERSARAFSALRAAAPQLELPLMHELHQALGTRGERLGRRVLSEIAQRLTIDPATVFDQLRHPDRRDHARAELDRGRALQLGTGPTLLYEHEHIITSIPLDAGPLATLITPMAPA